MILGEVMYLYLHFYELFVYYLIVVLIADRMYFMNSYSFTRFYSILSTPR